MPARAHHIVFSSCTLSLCKTGNTVGRIADCLGVLIAADPTAKIKTGVGHRAKRTAAESVRRLETKPKNSV